MLLLVLISKLVIAGLLLVPSFYEKGRDFLRAWRKWIFLIPVLIMFATLIYISYLHYQAWNASEVTKILNSNDSFGAELQRLGVGFAANYLDPIFRGINSFIKFIFPSYTGGTYLLFFLLTRLWGEYIISFIFAIIFLWAMLLLNRRFENRFFYDEEPYFGAIAIFITGWPGWLYYLIILLTMFLIFNGVATVIVKRKTKPKLGHPTTENQYFPPKADPSLTEGSRMSEEVGLRGGSRTSTGSPTAAELTTGESATVESRFSLYYFWITVAIAIILLMAYFQTDLPYYNLLKI